MSFARLPVLRHGLMLRHETPFSDAIFEDRIKTARQLMSEKGVKSLMAYSNGAGNGGVCYLTHYPCYGLARFALAVLGLETGPFLFTFEPSRNLPRAKSRNLATKGSLIRWGR